MQALRARLGLISGRVVTWCIVNIHLIKAVKSLHAVELLRVEDIYIPKHIPLLPPFAAIFTVLTARAIIKYVPVNGALINTLCSTLSINEEYLTMTKAEVSTCSVYIRRKRRICFVWSLSKNFKMFRRSSSCNIDEGVILHNLQSGSPSQTY